MATLDTAFVSPPLRFSPTGLVKLSRPKQWVKNVLVFGPAAAAGTVLEVHTILTCLLAFVAFSGAASGVYCMNDARDVDEDRLHPRKCLRPVARGQVSVPLAWIFGGVLVALSLTLAVVLSPVCAAVLTVYLLVQVAYSFGAKREPVVELVIVASGFVLRMIVGGLACHVTLSAWFLTVAGGGAMLVVSGKRLAELQRMGDDAGAHRAVLSNYSVVFLQLLVGIFGCLVILGYALWAFGADAAAGGHSATPSLLVQVSTVPFLTLILRYVLVAAQGGGGEPEELVGHRTMQLIGVVWVALFLTGVTHG